MSNLTAHRKPGLEALKKAAAKEGAYALANRLGVTAPFVYMMLAGKRHVSMYVACKLGAISVKSK